MHDAVTELMRTLAGNAGTEGRIADYLAAAADWADAVGEAEVANDLLDRARQHRVKAITQRARLDALAE